MSTPPGKWGPNTNIRVRRRMLYPAFARISAVCWRVWKEAILRRSLIRERARAARMSGPFIADSCARPARIKGRCSGFSDYGERSGLVLAAHLICDDCPSKLR